jgi:hypothetical protein
VGKAKRAHVQLSSGNKTAWARREGAPLPTLRVTNRETVIPGPPKAEPGIQARGHGA